MSNTKKSCVEYILQNKLSTQSKTKLQKLTIEELKSIILSPQNVPERIRPERILRELDDLSSSEGDDEKSDEKSDEQPQQEQPQQQSQQQQQEEEEEEEEVRINKIPKRQINCREIILPENEKVKKLSISEIKKVLRKMFSVYNKDLKLLCKDYKKDVINQEEFIKDFENVKNEYIIDLEEFLMLQPKVSDKIYDYVDNALESACKIIESCLE